MRQHSTEPVATCAAHAQDRACGLSAVSPQKGLKKKRKQKQKRNNFNIFHFELENGKHNGWTDDEEEEAEETFILQFALANRS